MKMRTLDIVSFLWYHEHMKKYGIINSAVSSVLSSLGHTDIIVICDAGFPIANDSNRIDLSLKKGFPAFIDVVCEIASDMIIEAITIADQIRDINPKVHSQILEFFNDKKTIYVSHDEFKGQAQYAKAIIRTGEITPYANIILQSGIFF